ncbi:hypothetical protein VNO77_16111 [Canavalia gladiata]|uniref:Uncharacterized protein n=1 Tax=Canavalia gladiata TaxID=3824 RepID=A0AAN9M0G2_CANGL
MTVGVFHKNEQILDECLSLLSSHDGNHNWHIEPDLLNYRLINPAISLGHYTIRHSNGYFLVGLECFWLTYYGLHFGNWPKLSVYFGIGPWIYRAQEKEGREACGNNVEKRSSPRIAHRRVSFLTFPLSHSISCFTFSSFTHSRLWL